MCGATRACVMHSYFMCDMTHSFMCDAFIFYEPHKDSCD